ncbi:hypothetical protein [Flexivirga lutea]
MRYNGVQATIDSGDGSQFEVLGTFWRLMRSQADPSQLRGIGHTWDPAGPTFEYLIGVQGDHLWSADEVSRLPGLGTARLGEIELPDDGWQTHRCAPADIAEMYAAIWRHGDLWYEMEHFDADGTFVTDVLYAG